MESVSYYVEGEKLTLTSTELAGLVGENYSPTGGLEDNLFFELHFESNGKGKAIFAFSKLGDEFEDVTADTFAFEETKKKIYITFSNGSVLSGTKTKNTLSVSGNGVEYLFYKK